MPKTVAEVLAETGLTSEQISAIDAKTMEGLTRVVSSANEAQDKAELALRTQRDEYDQKIAPALAGWADRDTVVTTENAALKAYLSKVKDGGYLPKEVLDAMPNFTGTAANGGTRGTDGKFVANANATPGSPAVVDTKKIEADLAGAFSFHADTSWKYRTLFGTEMPDAPTALIREATANRMSPSEWAAKKYNFAAKEAEVAAAKQKAHDDAIRKEQKEASDKEWAEKVGNNPNVRTPVESQFSQVSKAVADGKRTDPLKLTPEQRKANTHSNIQKEFAERSATVH